MGSEKDSISSERLTESSLTEGFARETVPNSNGESSEGDSHEDTSSFEDFNLSDSRESTESIESDSDSEHCLEIYFSKNVAHDAYCGLGSDQTCPICFCRFKNLSLLNRCYRKWFPDTAV